MKRKSRILAFCLVAFLIAGLVFTGCGNPAGSGQTETSTAGTSETQAGTTQASTTAKTDYSGVTLSMVLAKGWETNGRADLLKKFTEETGCQFDVQMLPDDMASEVIKTKYATNELADIMVNSGSVLEHSYMLPEEKLVELTGEPWVDQLVNKDSFMVNGKIWGLPLGSQGYFAFAVNTEVFKKYDLSIPTSKEELIQCFEVLKKNGVQPMYLGSKDPWLVGNMTSGVIAKALLKDPDLINKLNTNQLKYADIPGFAEAWQDLRDWNVKGYLGPNTMADSWDGQFKAFATDMAGVGIGLTSWEAQIDAKFPGTSDKIQYIPWYIGDCDTYFAGTVAQWYIPNSGKHIDAARDFFRFAARNENLTAFYSAMGVPTTPWKDILLDSPAPTKQVIDNLNSGKFSFHFGHNSLVQGQDWDGICKLGQEVLIGSKTPEDAVKEYDNMRAKIAKAQGMQGF